MIFYKMIGLPGSGKSTWIKNTIPNALVISADDFRTSHPEYDPDHPENLHQWAVAEAEKELYRIASKKQEFICLDSGGVNTNYSPRIMKKIREFGYHIVLVYIDTPNYVCLERIRQRERKVPEDVVIYKSLRIFQCFHNLKALADEVEIVNYFTNKHIFFDMDGTIAAMHPWPLDENGNANLVECSYFLYADPVMPVIEKANSLSSEFYILSAIPDGGAYEQKHIWLDNHFPISMDKRYFVGNKKYKLLMLKNILKNRKISMQDATLIDDNHEVLRSFRQSGINAIHPSEFLTW